MNSPRLGLVLDDLDGREKLANKLHQLELDAVLAWAGTERERARHADPSAYAAEVLESERAGLRLQPRLAEVLDQLANSRSGQNGKKLLFVQPVDDFDLAPARCLELLRIIRMVASRRLFFVIAGNTRLAENVLRLQGEGDLSSLTPKLAAGREQVWIWATATEIAASNLRKLAPPRQRVPLQSLSVEKARAMCESSGAPTLDQTLAAVSFQRNNAPPRDNSTDLRSFLFPEDGTTYIGAGWLEGTPRQVIDRIAMLGELRGDHSRDYGELLLPRVTEDIRRDLREYGRVNPEWRERILEVLDDTAGLRFNFRRTFAMRSEIGRVDEVKSEEVTLRCVFPSGYRWTIREPRNNEESERLPLPP